MTRDRETVAEFVDAYVDAYNRTTRDGRPRWNGQTEKILRSSLRPFVKAFGARTFDGLDSAPASVYRKWAREQPAAYVQRTRMMLGDALTDGLLARNPLAGIRLEHGRGRKDITVLTEPEIRELVSLAQEMGGTTWAAMVATAAYTCVRPGELFALRDTDVNLERGTLDVRRSFNGIEMKRPKNGQEREGIVLLPKAADRIAVMSGLEGAVCEMCLIDPHRRCVVCDGHGSVVWLFQQQGGQHFRKAALYRLWRPLREAFGHPDMDFYELRHAGATLLLEHGVEPEDVAWQMGHTDGGKLVRELYGEPHRAAEGRRERIRAAMA